VVLKLDPRRCSRQQPRQAVLSQQRLSLGCAPVETVKTGPAFMSAVRLRRLSPADGTVRHKQRQFQCERERYCGHEERTIAEKFTIGRPRYFRGAWLSTRCRGTDAEKTALKRFITECATPTDAADSLGRSPTSIVHYAHRLGLALPSEWSTLIQKRKIIEERAADRRR
jgi:hypothetical protein